MKTHISLQINNKNTKSTSRFPMWKRLMRSHSASKLARKPEQSQSLEKVSYDNQVLVLSENDAQKFVEMMQNPPKPSSALVALLKGGSVK